MTPELAQRVADALGWSVSDVHSFSLPALRELVRSVSDKLAHELTCAMATGRVITRKR